MILRSSIAALAAALLLAPATVAKPAKLKAKDVLSKGWPAISEAQRALTDVPFAPGAPAVVLLETESHDWEGFRFKRDRLQRRVKILTEDGVESHGSFGYTLYGDWRVQNVEARTVLPDGTVVDAKDSIVRERSSDGLQQITISFPQVRVGAILDLDVTISSDGLALDPYLVQETIPVLEARFVLQPPMGLRFRVIPVWLPPERVKPDHTFNVAGGKKAFAWIFRDVAPVPDVANLPPIDDVSKRLIVVMDAYKDSNTFFPIAADWKTWNESLSESVEDWMKRDSKAVESLARQVAGDAATPLAKAEAIRRALRDRFEVAFVSRFIGDESPDELLERGSGRSGALSALTARMLRAVGVEADVAVFRRRSDGIVPVEIPIPALFNDLMVRVGSGEASFFFCPAADINAARRPYDCSGVIALVLDGESDAPLPLDDFAAADNELERRTEAVLTDDGSLEATTVVAFREIAGEVWRSRLAGLGEERRRERIERYLRGWVPGLAVERVTIEHLDDPMRELTVTADWSAEGYATRTGSRMLLNTHLFARHVADDWAPAERSVQLDLRAAYRTIDTLTLTLPEGVSEVTSPDLVTFPAGPVGEYATSYEFDAEAGTLTARRTMQLNLFRFPPKSYPGLKRWFTAMAAEDDKPVVLTLR